MSQAHIPNITPIISLTMDESIIMLLSSIALEEMALAHLINAEAEKLQYVLGTLDTQTHIELTPDLGDLISVNASIQKTMNGVITKEILLLMKFEQVLELVERNTKME